MDSENTFFFLKRSPAGQPLVLLLAAICLFFNSYAVMAQENSGDAPALHLYPVNGVDFVYSQPHPDHISGDELAKTVVELTVHEGVYGTEKELDAFAGPVPVGEISKAGQVSLTAGAIQKIIETVLVKFNELGYMGVFILPHPQDISIAGQDLRPEGRDNLLFLVFTSTVEEISTFAFGSRFEGQEPGERKNLPEHEWIRLGSPLKPSALKNGEPGDLFNKNLTDEYITRLNRHPGRRVSLAVGKAQQEQKEGAALEYNVTESKPWVVYGQLTDTGTSNTAKWQKRAGLIHNQISGNDDILSVDFLTAGLDDYNSLYVAYEAPFLWNRLSDWRAGIEAGFSEFTASDVGLPGANFTGRTATLRTEATRLLRQSGEWFLDASYGLEWKDIEVDNDFAGVRGNENLLKPFFGLKAERKNRVVNTAGKLGLEINFSGIAGTDTKDLDGLGRSGADADWLLAKFSFFHSFFLEPLLFGDDFWDSSSPETSTIAHEVRINAKGQAVLDNSRLIPQEKMVIGGLYSVRGYPQSIASGDTAIMGSVEYRLHAPRLLPLNPNPEFSLFGDSFRMSPSQVYGYPDWDLVFKLFSDFGYTHNSDRILGLEENETLWSVGAGVELQLRKNLRLQLDYGHALLGLNNDIVDEGNHEAHLEMTLFY